MICGIYFFGYSLATMLFYEIITGHSLEMAWMALFFIIFLSLGLAVVSAAFFIWGLYITKFKYVFRCLVLNLIAAIALFSFSLVLHIMPLIVSSVLLFIVEIGIVWWLRKKNDDRRR